MQENKGSYIMGGLGVMLLVVIGLMSYNAGKIAGAKNMHMGMMQMDSQSLQGGLPTDHSKMTMEQMTKGLAGLQGDEFDRAFVEMMIVHHQGAVDMAKLIPAQAKHEELKKLGGDIITTQTKEIEMMKGWIKAWGYENGTDMMDHSKMVK
jgi:uncharacterized protein (DUF305 family)